MTNLYFPELPDRIYMECDADLGSATRNGQAKDLSGQFRLIIDGKDITSFQTISGSQIVSAKASGGRWFLSQCLDGNGPIESELKQSHFGHSGLGPRIVLGVTGFPKLRIRKTIPIRKPISPSKISRVI